MTQNEKNLLLKDLYGRLPYGVKAVLKRTNCHDSTKHKVNEKDIYSFRTGRPLEEDYGQHDYYKVIVTDIKPYLLPLSSMTKEQKKFFDDKNIECDGWEIVSKEGSHYQSCYTDIEEWIEVIDWLNKNHFDYRGLIKKSLAIDATGLNIY